VIDNSAAKSATANFSKAVSKEFGRRRIRVNTVSPGPAKTGPWLGDQGVAATVAAAAGGDAADVAKQQAATDRFTRAEEVADVVVLLASGRAGNLTGSDVVIDGGLSTTL
jgi:NAD(P)-dependent dehydrogenase (short-subunit alcohol dehydrogenase family)